MGLIGLVPGEIKSHNLKNVHFQKKGAKVKNIKFIFNESLAQFCFYNRIWLNCIDVKAY